MSKRKRQRRYSDIDSHYICSVDGHRIIKPAELPFSIIGADSNSVIYADDCYYSNPYRLDDNFHTYDKPITK
jgi:hypothetical protein